jgi:UDP-N-acetylmuramate: L-alanyl-gamma-D-glutamyl-meso-diaminopimelate ligase
LEDAVLALGKFKGVKRRLELLGKPRDIAVYDDFAHHPTAIESTLLALRAQTVSGKLIALIEPRSNTMRMGKHRECLAEAARGADHALWFEPAEMNWDLGSAVGATPGQEVFRSIDLMIDRALALATSGDNIVVMSNGGFGGLHNQLMTQLEARVTA